MTLTPDELRRRADNHYEGNPPYVKLTQRDARDLADELERREKLYVDRNNEFLELGKRYLEVCNHNEWVRIERVKVDDKLAAMREVLKMVEVALDITYYRVWHDSKCQKSEIEGDPCDCGHEQVLTVAKEALAKIRALKEE